VGTPTQGQALPVGGGSILDGKEQREDLLLPDGPDGSLSLTVCCATRLSSGDKLCLVGLSQSIHSGGTLARGAEPRLECRHIIATGNQTRQRSGRITGRVQPLDIL